MNIQINLDTKAAINYLLNLGFEQNLLNQTDIKSVFVKSSKDYLEAEISTLLYCSIVNKLYYTDTVNNKINLEPQLENLLQKLSELQYYSQTNNQEEIEKLKHQLKKYLQ